MSELHGVLVRALKKTETLWPALSQAYGLVHQAAHVLANHEDEPALVVRERAAYAETIARVFADEAIPCNLERRVEAPHIDAR